MWGDGEGYGAALKPVAVVSAAPGDLSYILSYSSMNTSGCWYGSWRKTLFGSGAGRILMVGTLEFEGLGCGIESVLIMVAELEVGVGLGDMWRSWTIDVGRRKEEADDRGM
jgi:hypothetical protein